MKKNFMKYSILIGIGMVLGVFASNIGSVFGASNQSNNNGNPVLAESIINTGCIEYTLPSGYTGIKCDQAIVYLKTGTTQEHSYFLQKWQKTGGMTRFTTGVVSVQSGGYIQYKIDFGSITGNCNKGTLKDLLPSCVKYVSSSIVGVSGDLSTGNNYLQYSNIKLNAGAQGYVLITGQIIANTSNCENVTKYTNTGQFMCQSPHSEWMYSSVVAIRTGGGGGNGSEVIFTKSGNKDEMYPGETGLKFTLKVENKGPKTITGIVIDDIRPGTDGRNCIIYDGWSGLNWKQSGQDYTWNYIGNNGRLASGQYATLYVYAKIRNDSSCIGSYINTGKLTYQEGGNSHVLYDYHPFDVVDGSVGYDVSIEKTVDHQKVVHGQTIHYYIDYTNIGTKPLTDYTIVDNWPNDKMEFISSTPSPLTNNGDTITWHFSGPLAPGKAGRITIEAKVR